MSNFSSLLNSFKMNTAAASASTSKEKRKRSHEHLSTELRPASLQSCSRKRCRPQCSPLNSSFELSFLVIGGQKCGTTWLHSLLQKCSQISLPTHMKEVHYWDWHYHRGFDWYVRQFRPPQHLLQSPQDRKLARNGQAKQLPDRSTFLHGEITPCYVVLPESTVAEISHRFPRLKVIFVARDLVDRAWSAMIMELRDQSLGLKPGEFANGLGGGRETKRGTGGEFKKARPMSAVQERRLQSLASPSSQPDSYYLERLRHSTHDSRSNYAKHLKNWYSHFPPTSILIIDYNEIESDPRGVLTKVIEHTGVEAGLTKAFVESLDESQVRQKVNAATNSIIGGPDKGASMSSTSQDLLSLRPKLKKQMERYLSPYAREFNTLLSEKGYSWKLNDYTKPPN